MSASYIASNWKSAQLVLFGLLLCIAEGKTGPLAGAQSVPSNSAAPGEALPLNFARHTDDLDAMVRRKTIRALVLYSRTGFFYVDGRPEGIYYESLRAFEQFANENFVPRNNMFKSRSFLSAPIRLSRL
jgi:hypothetical protein